MLKQRIPGVYKLIGRLEDVAYSDDFMFGHQNAGHIGVSITNKDGSESDIKNLVGKHPAVVGIDTLGFYGYEGNMEQLVRVVKELHREGCIITLSSHMPNFSLGGDDFFDYSPNFTDGDVGYRILPGGDLNEKYRRFLDAIAEFASLCVDVDGEPIPMLFRPFHEDNGNWFWWGREYLPDDKYVTLYRYTVDYLQDEKGVTSFAYAYSPNGFFDDDKHYLRRYPGDDYIDVLGMDIYRDRPSPDDGFYDKLKSSLQILWQVSLEHGKPYALTELGIRVLDSVGGYYEGLAPTGNIVKNCFTEFLEFMCSFEAGGSCSYVLTWANFSDQQFWVPYELKDKDGNVTFRHEMCDDFIKFVSDPHVILAP